MSKIKVLIVEDEAIIANNIFDTLEELGYNPLESVGSYSEAIELINADPPDIAILDIQLGGQKNGIDLAQEINRTYGFPFIFLSSNSDTLTVEQVKRVEPSAYLVKPFGKEELYTSIEVAFYNFSRRNESDLNTENLAIQDALFIKENKVFMRLNFDEIVYMQSDHIYIDLFLQNGKKHSVRGSLNEYMNKLGSSFFRTHRSYIVNLKYLQELKQNKVSINNTELPIGQNQREELLSKLSTG